MFLRAFEKYYHELAEKVGVLFGEKEKERFLARKKNNYSKLTSQMYHIERYYSPLNPERYEAINFRAYLEHRTIEFRIFPYYASLEQFELVINSLVSFINEWVNDFFTRGFVFEFEQED